MQHDSKPDFRFAGNVLIKGLLLFLIVNFGLASFDPLPGLGRWSAYNAVIPGRARLPYGDRPDRAYNLSLYQLEAMFASHEIAGAARLSIHLEEQRVNVRGDVRAACEILGLDPMQVACEGRFLAVLPAAAVEDALAVLRRFPQSEQAAVVGEVKEAGRTPVVLRSRLGPARILDMGSGEQLPRIC